MHDPARHPPHARGLLYTELETLLAQMLPFVYSNMIKAVLLLYILAFPFGVAVQLGWFTPALAFVGALIFLSIDRVGAVMESPFVDDEVHGLDLHKRIRRTDKETAALVGVCRSARGVRRVMTLPQASCRYGSGLPWRRTLARGGGSRFEPQSPRTEEGEEARGVAGGRRLEAERGDELRLLEQPVARGVERVEALEQLRHAWQWQAADAPRRGRTRLVSGGGASASGAPPRWGAS